MTFGRFSRWSAGLYNGHFERPLARSLPFVAVTVLLLVTLAREALLLAGTAGSIPPRDRVLFLSIVAMTPSIWAQGILQHRRHRQGIRIAAEPHRGLTATGALAADYLNAATLGYLLLSLALGMIR